MKGRSIVWRGEDRYAASNDGSVKALVYGPCAPDTEGERGHAIGRIPRTVETNGATPIELADGSRVSQQHG